MISCSPFSFKRVSSEVEYWPDFVFLGFSLHQKNSLAGCNERSCSIEKKSFFQKKLSKEKLVLEELLANLFLVTEINDNYSKETKNSFDIESDIDIGKVDPEYLYEVLSNIDLNDVDALFISCTALPVLQIIDRLEKKFNKPVLSSNQALIWETLEKIGMNKSVSGFGKLFSN